jgi:hypothetical protein
MAVAAESLLNRLIINSHQAVAAMTCTGNRFGEVVGVLPADAARALIADTPARPCQASVDEFLGVQGTMPP